MDIRLAVGWGIGSGIAWRIILSCTRYLLRYWDRIPARGFLAEPAIVLGKNQCLNHGIVYQ